MESTLFRALGWEEAADLIIKGVSGGILKKRVNYDFERLNLIFYFKKWNQ